MNRSRKNKTGLTMHYVEAVKSPSILFDGGNAGPRCRKCPTAFAGWPSRRPQRLGLLQNNGLNNSLQVQRPVNKMFQNFPPG
jgi:hypothetical protein